MPELPEVETTKNGISPWVTGNTIEKLIIRVSKLRWMIESDIKKKPLGKVVQSVKRRAKYILLEMDHGSAIIHLGMSGSLRIIKSDEPPMKHDHFDIVFKNGISLRYRDPRKFGAFFWSHNPSSHRLFQRLGPEPLCDEFSEKYLWEKSRKRKVTIKQFIMNSQVVVGVGNIYASESLFLAGIRPSIKTGRLSRKRMKKLVEAIKKILIQAIKSGGTTLQDFYMSDGNPGYFKQKLKVYGREKEPCVKCGEPISIRILGQRSTFYCRICQI